MNTLFDASRYKIHNINFQTGKNIKQIKNKSIRIFSYFDIMKSYYIKQSFLGKLEAYGGVATVKEILLYSRKIIKNRMLCKSTRIRQACHLRQQSVIYHGHHIFELRYIFASSDYKSLMTKSHSIISLKRRKKLWWDIF